MLKRLRQFINKFRFLLLAATAAGAVGLRLIPHAYEPVMALPPSGLLGIWDGNVYSLQTSERTKQWTLIALDLRTRTRTTVLSGPANEQLRLVGYSNDRLVFHSVKQRHPTNGQLLQGRSISVLHLVNRLSHKVQRTEIKTPGIQGPVVLNQGTCYWICEESESGRLEVVSQPLGGGKPRVLLDRLPRSARLFDGGEGVLMSVNVRLMGAIATNVERAALYSLTQDRCEKLKLSRFLPINVPLVHAGGVYWIEHLTAEADSLGRQTPDRDAIVRYDLATKEKTEIATQISEPKLLRLFTGLSVHNGKLMATKAEQGIDQPSGRFEILPLSDKPWNEPPIVLPGNATGEYYLDGDSLFVPVMEQRENLFDWSEEGLTPTRTWRLFRYSGKAG